jgi:hypothetical protein
VGERCEAARGTQRGDVVRNVRGARASSRQRPGRSR